MIKETIQLNFDGNGSSLRSAIASVYKRYGISWNKDIWTLFQDAALNKYADDIEQFAVDPEANLICPFCGHYGCKILWKRKAMPEADMHYAVKIPDTGDLILLELPSFIVCGSECVKLDMSWRDIINRILVRYPDAAINIVDNKLDATALIDSIPMGGHLYFLDRHLCNTQGIVKWVSWGEFAWNKSKMLDVKSPVLKSTCRKRKVWKWYPGYRPSYKDSYAFILHGGKRNG